MTWIEERGVKRSASDSVILYFNLEYKPLKPGLDVRRKQKYKYKRMERFPFSCTCACACVVESYV